MRCEVKKKASFCNEALKGSLNLEVSKGSEETTGAKFNSLPKLHCIRVFPRITKAIKKIAQVSETVQLALFGSRRGLFRGVAGGGGNRIEVGFCNVSGLLYRFLHRLQCGMRSRYRALDHSNGGL